MAYVDPQDAHSMMPNPVMGKPPIQFPKAMYHPDGGFPKIAKSDREQKIFEAQGWQEELPEGTAIHPDGSVRTIEELQAEQHRNLFGREMYVTPHPFPMAQQPKVKAPK